MSNAAKPGLLMYMCIGFLLLSDCRNSNCATTTLETSSFICKSTYTVAHGVSRKLTVSAHENWLINSHVDSVYCLLISTPPQHVILSYDQLRAASLIGWNAVTWRWALSYVHHFTVTRCDNIMSHMWHYNVTRCDVTWCSLNSNVRHTLFLCLHLVCLFFCFLASYCKFFLNTVWIY